MQIIVLLIMMALVVDAQGAGWRLVNVSPAARAAIALAPYALLAIAALLASRWALRLIVRTPQHTPGVLKWLDRFTAIHRLTLLGVFVMQVAVLGMVDWIRRLVGDLVLAPSLLALVLPIGTMVLSWWAYYPIDRRMREAALMRQLDTGQPLPAIWSAGQFVLSQLRHHVLLVLVPLLVLLTWTQVVDRYLAADELSHTALTLAGSVAVFVTAPLMIRMVWDTAPLPPGELRDRLLAMCRVHRVRIRRLLLWRTYGGLINGAVMGLVGHVRYILLTDGLLERMNDDQVEAVMAHEIAHIRRHHMLWMLVTLAAISMAVGLVMDAAMLGVEVLLGRELQAMDAVWHAVIEGAGWVMLVVGVVVIFGWVSRRFERQADTFAVQHLSARYPDAALPPGVVGAPAVRIFTDALLRVASLNHIPVERRSWRHGSIRWRVDYLRGLIGTPLEHCAIDRQVRRITWSALGVLAALVALSAVTRMWAP